jgi:hypothetical protein
MRSLYIFKVPGEKKGKPSRPIYNKGLNKMSISDRKEIKELFNYPIL